MNKLITTTLPDWFHERTREQFITETELCGILKYKPQQLSDSVKCGQFPKEDRNIQNTRLWKVDSVKNILITMTAKPEKSEQIDDAANSKELLSALKSLTISESSKVRLLKALMVAVKTRGNNFHLHYGFSSFAQLMRESKSEYSEGYLFTFKSAAIVLVDNNLDWEKYHPLVSAIKQSADNKSIFETCHKLMESHNYDLVSAYRLAYAYHTGEACNGAAKVTVNEAVSKLGAKNGVNYRFDPRYSNSLTTGQVKTANTVEKTTPNVVIVSESVELQNGEIDSCMKLLEFFVTPNCDQSVFDISEKLNIEFDELMDMLAVLHQHSFIGWDAKSDDCVIPDVEKIKTYLAASSIEHNIKEAADVLKYNKELVTCLSVCKTPNVLKPEHLVISAMKQGHKILTREATFFLSVLVDKKLATVEGDKYSLVTEMPKLALDIQSHYENPSLFQSISFNAKQKEILASIKGHSKAFPALIDLVNDYGCDTHHILLTDELIEAIAPVPVLLLLGFFQD